MHSQCKCFFYIAIWLIQVKGVTKYIFLSCNGFISTALQVFALIFKALMPEREIDVTTAIEIFGLDWSVPQSDMKSSRLPRPDRTYSLFH